MHLKIYTQLSRIISFKVIQGARMARLRQEGLTAREMELIQVLWQQKEATVEMIQAKLPDRLEGSTIRTLLQIMEDKGYVAHEKQGRANVYRPIIEQQLVQSVALKYIIQKLFGGSAELLLARLVKDRGIDLDDVIRLRKKLK
ncbi:MAG: BlaI/MecI/CopY family transcriptional regulator [Gemmatimonadetes bacterium]|nr:BlaI/MecI/CopY family transcriptional regulator [Gemmatimonadota bacterium]MYK50214.1 BlaI/MecI/CopY family transcriptional regulator [Gemmatimonadota bacterium]